MVILINILFDILHITKFIIICDLFLVLTKKSNKIVMLYIATMVMSIIFSVFILDSTVTIMLYLAFIFCVYVFRYKGNYGKLFLASLWTNVFIAILDNVVKVIINTIFILFTITSTYLQRLFMSLLTLGFLFITGTLLRKKHRTGIKNIGIWYYIGFTILSCADFVILIFLNEFAINKLILEQRTKFQIVFLIVSIGMLFQMAMVIFLVVSRNVYRENQQLASKYLNDQKKHYEYLETRERETKKFRHDLRHHMYILNTLNRQGDHEMLDKYMQKINGEIDCFGSRICVNNGIVDAILNKFADEAEKEGIKLQVEGHFPMKCHIDAFDLCTIFSNLLSNAMEAEKKSQGNTIRMSCRFTSDHIVACIENNSVVRKIEKNGKLETTKEDKWNHGFGLENVKECVKQNGGEILIENEMGIFRVTVVLNNEES